MKFGIRQIANVVFKAKSTQKIGQYTFKAGQPVFYLDTAKTSTMEGAATTVYAQGGRGNSRLISWEGEKTLTFTVEDALLSPISFAMLSGAGLIKSKGTDNKKIHFHQTSTVGVDVKVTTSGDTASSVLTVDLGDALEADEKVCGTAPIYVIKLDRYGDLTGEIIGDSESEWALDSSGKKLTLTLAGEVESFVGMVDYYVIKDAATVSELQIDAEHFAGYYYVEADTLFRRQQDGKDLPANLTFPNVKIQSNFTFSMASSGDPSTFTFTMDALPGYTYFDRTKKVLCAMQIVDDAGIKNENQKSVFLHGESFSIDESKEDSIPSKFIDIDG